MEITGQSLVLIVCIGTVSSVTSFFLALGQLEFEDGGYYLPSVNLVLNPTKDAVGATGCV